MLEYLNQRTPFNPISRYQNHRKITVEGTLALETWNEPTIEPQATDKFHKVHRGEQHRIWLVSHRVYGIANLWWVIAMANGLKDPVSEVKVGRLLRIPDRDYIMSKVLIR